MHKKYDFIDHTADLSVKVYGKNLEEIFINSSTAMMDLICNINMVRPLKSININVSGSTNEQLLVNWLQELLYIHEVKNLLFCSFIIKSITKNNVSGSIQGEEFDKSRHELLNDIKAVTYNKMDIRKVGNKYSTIITFDI
jgi:SHS2 domain-containing protein